MFRKILRFLFKTVWGLTKLAILTALMFFLVLEGETIRRQVIWLATADSTVLLFAHRADGNEYSGTAFYARTSNGQVVAISNRHVCEESTDGHLHIVFNDGSTAVTRIIRMSKKVDLCMLEAPPFALPLRVGNYQPMPSDMVFAFGHPDGMPLTWTQGTVIGRTRFSTTEQMSAYDVTYNRCQWENSKIETIDGKLHCTETGEMVHTTIPVDGGSSGSPLLDSYGSVAGVVSAMTTSNGWAAAIPLDQLKGFLGGKL
jgi:S1-C subfamily serine protease